MYLKWKEKTLSDFSDKFINAAYSDGFLLTRLGKGKMEQTRSLRVNLSKFELSSENRRVLRKTENLTLEKYPLPLHIANPPLLGEGQGVGFFIILSKP